MQTFKMGYYTTGTSNGVTFYGELMEDPDANIMKATDFYETLDTLEDTETLYTFFGPENKGIWEKINKEYGITD